MKGVLPTGYVTDRELQVWKHIALGHQNRGIAALLGASIKTVEKHRQQLLRKLDAHTAADLTRKAIEHGVIEVSIRPLTREVCVGAHVRHLLPQPMVA